MAAKMAAILDFTEKVKFSGNMRKLQIYVARVVKYDTIKHFATFGSILYVFIRKKVKNTHFLLKNGLTSCYS